CARSFGGGGWSLGFDFW
nr:immunoglobulin heavy chain junction region [Macaca mulatta]MOX91603.1 immunoglobulin heavy chain junction region [Macaca mulatta]MOX91729.1 immunoglobulin heavy chain junction region [Macaca mulatta]MOX91950.1 immunoglobulin heavy chain junction region [Macaca mulatta]MOX92136.1 immunoglobulin heavy chain junction region [Macaca mulatta]